MPKLQRLYAGYSDNKANSAQFQLGLGLSLAKSTKLLCVFKRKMFKDGLFHFLIHNKGQVKCFTVNLLTIVNSLL